MSRLIALCISLWLASMPTYSEALVYNGYNDSAESACFVYEGKIQCVDWEEKVVTWRSDKDIAGHLFYVDEEFNRLAQNVRNGDGYQLEVVEVKSGRVLSRSETDFPGDVVASPDLDSIFIVGDSSIAIARPGDARPSVINFDHDLGHYQWAANCACLEVQEWETGVNGSSSTRPDGTTAYRVYPDGALEQFSGSAVIEIVNIRVWLDGNIHSTVYVVTENIQTGEEREFSQLINPRSWVAVADDGVVRIASGAGGLQAAIDGRTGEMLRIRHPENGSMVEPIGTGVDKALSRNGFILRHAPSHGSEVEFYVEDIGTGDTVREYENFWD